MTGQRQELMAFSLRICGDRIFPLWSEDLVEVKSLSNGWIFYFSDLSAFTVISDTRFLLLRSLRIRITTPESIVLGALH